MNVAPERFERTRIALNKRNEYLKGNPYHYEDYVHSDSESLETCAACAYMGRTS
jgi:hypothetical protein